MHLHQQHSNRSTPSTNATTMSSSMVGVDTPVGGGLYNIARQRASHDFPSHSMDDLEVVGLRRLTGVAGEHSEPQRMMTPAQHSPASQQD
jgi:hypothetical protein